MRFTKEALVLLADDEKVVATWPYAGLKFVDEGGRGRPMRLASVTDPDARLTIADASFPASLRAVAPHVRGRGASGAGRLQTALWVVGIAAVAVALVLVAPRLAGPVAALIPAAWEAELGERIAGQILADARICDSRAGTEALERLVARLAETVEVPYAFVVSVADTGQVNAFAAPGGHIVIFRGLLEFAQSADEAAGVLAHEMAHVIERHPTQAILRAAGVSLLFDMLTGGASTLAGIGELLIGLSFSRRAEADADAIAVAMLEATDIRASGLGRFLARLDKQGRDLPAGLSFLSSHPSPTVRVEALADAAAGGRPAMPSADWRAVREMCR